MIPLTVLWFGGGQDSTDLLYRYLYSKQFRDEFVGNSHFLAIMSDTGNEFDYTYQHVKQVAGLCLRKGIEFYHIEPWMGYHSQAWQSLSGQFRRNHNIMSVAYPKTCTDNLKIGPNYRFLADYIRNRYGFDAKGNNVFYQYTERFGKLMSIIGFAKGEESRCGLKAQMELFPELHNDPRPLWMQRCVEHIYPLISLGVDRAGCQESIARFGHTVPLPSNCKKCPFASNAELVYLNRFYPNDWNEWVADEQNKINKWAGKTALNYGVKGTTLLPEILKSALSVYGGWSNKELINYRMSHGHNVRSKI